MFEYPQFSAVVDIGGVVNTGVFVAEPNTDTYHDIMRTYEKAPSYNRGDQGFLNYYFNQSIHPLPGNYNLMVKFTVISLNPSKKKKKIGTYFKKLAFFYIGGKFYI